ncbi:MAG: CAP domain-containing protein [Pseudomonadota bacterium]
MAVTMRQLMKIAIVLMAAGAVAGCGIPRLGFGDKPAATVPNVPRERSVDPARALALINEHRTSRGRTPLKHDPRLSGIARETARELARRNTLRTEMHTSQGIAKRLDAANYTASRAAENLGAGYPTLVLTVEGWKDSRGHNKNLLNREVTHAGIGLALTGEGPYKSFWVLLLAAPDEAA